MLPDEIRNTNFTIDTSEFNTSLVSYVGDNIVRFNVTYLIDSFKVFAEANSANAALQSLAISIEDDLISLKAGHLSTMDTLCNDFKNITKNVSAILLEIQTSLINVANDTDALVRYVDNDATQVLSRSIDIEVTALFGEFIHYVGNVIRKVTSRIGRCEVIPETYDSIKTLFCFYLCDSLNSLWFSIGIATFAFVAFLPSYLSLARHYQIGALDFDIYNTEETLEVTNTAPLIQGRSKGKGADDARKESLTWY